MAVLIFNRTTHQTRPQGKYFIFTLPLTHIYSSELSLNTAEQAQNENNGLIGKLRTMLQFITVTYEKLTTDTTATALAQ